MQKYYAIGPSLRFVLLCLLVTYPIICIAADDRSEQWEHQLLSIGEPGPRAVDMRVWTQKAPSQGAKTGAPATVRIRCSGEAYLTAIYLSPGGDVIVLLPNRSVPTNVMLPEKEYTLFGPESPIKLKESDMSNDARIIFYVSSAPLQVASLGIPPDDPYLRIPQSSSQDMKGLIDKLTSLSRDPKFNREVLALRDADNKGPRFEIMGLPQNVTSSKPVGVSGAAGTKDKVSVPSKE